MHNQCLMSQYNKFLLFICIDLCIHITMWSISPNYEMDKKMYMWLWNKKFNIPKTLRDQNICGVHTKRNYSQIALNIQDDKNWLKWQAMIGVSSTLINSTIFKIKLKHKGFCWKIHLKNYVKLNFLSIYIINNSMNIRIYSLIYRNTLKNNLLYYLKRNIL